MMLDICSLIVINRSGQKRSSYRKIIRMVEPKPPVTAWQVESLRFTTFLSPSAENPDPNWWEVVVGEPPQSLNAQPKQGIVQAVGSVEGGFTLVLGIQPARVDWMYGRPDEGDSIAPLEESINRFAEFLTTWFEICPSAVRLAFGAILLIPVGSKEDGYRLLNRYLPSFTLDAERSSDFSYQINRWRLSQSIEGLRINRLSRWSTAKRQKSTIAIGPGGIVPSQLQDAEFSCRLELDINTAPEYEGEFDQGRTATLYQELVTLGIEITDKGDIP